MGRPVENLTGRLFGKLFVIKRTKNRGENAAWLCRCVCGKETVVLGTRLVCGRTKSCGCASPRSTTHGGSRSRLYSIWRGMRFRCQNTSSISYKYYGGRGIKVCPAWEDFAIFQAWAFSTGYMDTLSIDRKDNNVGYQPDNCEWVLPMKQSGNRRSCKKLSYNGHTHTLYEWSKITGLNHSTLYSRFKRCLSAKDILRGGKNV
jgi:hypothetical protein